MGFFEIFAISSIGFFGILAVIFMVLFFRAESDKSSAEMRSMDDKIEVMRVQEVQKQVAETFNLDQNSNDYSFKLEPIEMVDINISNINDIKAKRKNNENRYYFELTADLKHVPNKVNYSTFKLDCPNTTKEFKDIDIYPQHDKKDEPNIKFTVCVETEKMDKKNPNITIKNISIIPVTKNIIEMNAKYSNYYCQLPDDMSINILQNGDLACKHKNDQNKKGSTYINVYNKNDEQNQIKTPQKKILLNANNILNLNSAVLSNGI